MEQIDDVNTDLIERTLGELDEWVGAGPEGRVKTTMTARARRIIIVQRHTIARYRSLLADAAGQFAMYAKNHRKKVQLSSSEMMSDDARAKAVVNEGFAERLYNAIDKPYADPAAVLEAMTEAHWNAAYAGQQGGERHLWAALGEPTKQFQRDKMRAAISVLL